LHPIFTSTILIRGLLQVQDGIMQGTQIIRPIRLSRALGGDGILVQS